VHKLVEGGHRRDAWNAVLVNVRPAQEAEVEGAMQRALSLWLAYRDAVAGACGISR
jgi:pyrroloquinoline-quinone synthase